MAVDIHWLDYGLIRAYHCAERTSDFLSHLPGGDALSGWLMQGHGRLSAEEWVARSLLQGVSSLFVPASQNCLKGPAKAG